MDVLKPGPERSYPLRTIRSPEGNTISVSPVRGGTIVSLKLAGRELLYLDKTTFRDSAQNVRGGISVLFPNCGALTAPPGHPLSGLKQHGFARLSGNWTMLAGNRGFEETLASDEDTRGLFPYDFLLTLRGILREDGSLLLEQEVTNPSLNTRLPVAMGLHPHFRVSRDRKADIRFDFPGGEAAERENDVWLSGGTLRLDNPGVPLRISLPGTGTLSLLFSPVYKRVWIWSLPERDFICVEPALRDPGGLLRDPELVPPQGCLSGYTEIRIS